MRVIIDSELCQGHLRCQAKAPSLFDSDDEGYGVAVDRPLDTDAEVSLAKAAIGVCPERAIRIET